MRFSDLKIYRDTFKNKNISLQKKMFVREISCVKFNTNLRNNLIVTSEYIISNKNQYTH